MFSSSILLAAALAVAAPPQAGDAAPQLQQGDAAIVVDKDVAFTQRGRTVARLPVGTTLKVLAVRREKVQVRVKVDGKVRDGWIAAGAVRPRPAEARTNRDGDGKKAQDKRREQDGKQTSGVSDKGRPQGTWVWVFRQIKGVQLPIRRGDYMTFYDDGVCVCHRDNQTVKVKYTFDPLANPKRYSYTIVGVPVQGIYKVQGDTITMCERHGNAPPNRFAATKKDSNFLYVLKFVRQPRAVAAKTPVPKFGADGKPPLRYEQTIETTAKSGLKGRSQRTLMKQVNRVAVVALKPSPSGERRARIIYESVRVTGNGVPPALKQVYSRFAGASLTATLNARGEITKLDGYEALIERLSGGNAELAQRVRQTFRKDALKQMFAGWFARMPPGDIEKGTSWKNKGTFAAGPVGEIVGELTTTYQGRTRLGGRECGQFKLEAESTYVLPSGGGILGYEIVKGQLKITGPRGEQFFDVKTGHIVQSNHSTRARGRVTVKVGGRQATLNVDNKDTVRVRLLSGLGTASKDAEEPATTKKQPALRKWTSSTGKFSIEAKLLEVKDGNVRLLRPDGKIIAVPVSKLSKADRKYLASIAKAKNKPAAPDEGEKQEKSDAEKIQGKWTLVEYLHKGVKSGEAGTVVTFSGKKMTSTPAGGGNAKVEMAIELRPNKKPPEMDMVMKLGGKTFTTGAIYELSGDTLKICSRGPGEPRPKKIGSTSVDGQQLMVLKRAKRGGKK